MSNFRNILVPTDFGEASVRAVDLALDLARRYESKVTLLHATLFPAAIYGEYALGLSWPNEQLEGSVKRELETAVAKAKESWPSVEGHVTVGGEPWARILEVAEERDADLIVVGTHGRRGLAHIFLGSVAEVVVRMSPIPVLTVCPEARRRATKRLLDAYRGS